MFRNIGKKIKIFAMVLTGIGIAASCISGIAVMFFLSRYSVQVVPGLLIIIFGSFFSWLSSFFMYGFGQLIDNTDILVQQGKNGSAPSNNYNVSNENANMSTMSTATNVSKSPLADGSYCPHCNNKIIVPEGVHSAVCPWCNKTFTL